MAKRKLGGVNAYRHRETGIVMVRVPGGMFFMGSPTDGRSSELLHRAEVDGFLISKIEVTQEEWTTVMESNPSAYVGERQPVERVTWSKARLF